MEVIGKKIVKNRKNTLNALLVNKVKKVKRVLSSTMSKKIPDKT